MSANLTELIRDAPISSCHDYVLARAYTALIVYTDEDWRELHDLGELRAEDNVCLAEVEVLRCKDCGHESLGWRRL